MPVTLDDIQAAARTIAGEAHRTPVHTSQTLNVHLGARAFLKCENFQRAGAFKFRGAFNALSTLSQEERRRGVLTYSSGNHAQALSLAGRILGVNVTVVMPNDAPEVKRRATEAYGGHVVLYDRDETSRETLGARLAAEKGLTVVPPYDHLQVVAGQGTVALELLQDVSGLDVVFVPCGGGGLLSGCAVATKALSPQTRVIGVEPATADDATQSFRTGSLVSVKDPVTIADGARTPSLGQITFPLVMQFVDDFVTVSDDELLRATHFLWERTKLVVEPTGALGLAGALKAHENVKGLSAGIVLSGGNADFVSLAAHWARLRL